MNLLTYTDANERLFFKNITYHFSFTLTIDEWICLQRLDVIIWMVDKLNVLSWNIHARWFRFNQRENDIT